MGLVLSWGLVVCRTRWGLSCYSCDITVVGRMFWTYRNLQNRKTAVCSYSFYESGNQQNWKLASPGLLILQKQEISKTGRPLSHGISGDAILVDQHIAKNRLIHAQFYVFKGSTKDNKQPSVQWSQKFSKTHNGLLTVSRISSTIFKKVRKTTFVHSITGIVASTSAVQLPALIFWGGAWAASAHGRLTW